MLIQIKNQDDIILLSLRKVSKKVDKKLLKGVFLMKRLNSINLEKVNGAFYLLWVPGYSDQTMRNAGIKIQKHFFIPDTYYSPYSENFVSFFEANLITYLVRAGLIKKKANSTR